MRYGGLAGAAALALAVAGCSGGGGNPGECFGSAEVCGGVQPAPPTPSGSPVGLYKGFTNTNRVVYALVLSTPEIWLLSSLSGTNVPTGADRGTWTATDTTLSSTDLADFSTDTTTVGIGNLDATYVSGSRLTGSVVAPGQSFTFTTTYQTGFTTQGTLAALAGSYTGSAVMPGATDVATATVTSDGVVNGSTVRGCNFSGQLLTSPGISTYTASLSFTGVGCPQNPTPLTAGSGVAILDGSQLNLAVFNAARTQGFAFAGGR